MPVTQEQADALLQAGQISPDTHSAISASNGIPASIAAPPEPVPQGGPVDQAFVASQQPVGGMPGGPPPVVAPPPGVGVDGRMDYVPGPLSSTAPPPGADLTPPPVMQPPVAGAPPVIAPVAPQAPAPEGRVEVGPITTVRPPLMAPMGSGLPSTGGPRRTTGYEDQAAAQNRVLAGAMEEQRKVNDLQAMRGVEQADLDAKNQAERDQQRVLDLAAQKDENDHRDALMADRGAKLNDYLNAKVDPLQVQKQRGSIGNALAMVAMGLGAFGAQKGGGPNYAMQILNKQVDDNIASQEANIVQQGRGIQAMDNSISQLRAITGDNEAARAAARVELYTKQRDSLQGIMSKYGDATQKAAGEQALTMIQGHIDENSAIVKQRNETLAAQQAAAAAVQRRAQEAKIGATAAEYVGKGMDPIEAMRTATAIHSGRLVGQAPLQAVPDREGRQKAADRADAQASKLAPRTVILPNGKPRLAVSEQAGKDYKEWQDSAPDIQGAYQRGRKAWADGDVAGYESARAQFLDAAPKYFLGSSASGPTKGQLKETYTHLFPEYRHWYHPLDAVTQGRTDTALDALGAAMRTRDQTINDSTFEHEDPNVGFTPSKAAK